jgi:sigma-54-dependent transcriptional regulator
MALTLSLHGYKRGAFSGAQKDKKGLVEAADGGTLFLDEIGDLPINLQAKLLRVLQDQKVRPLGALESCKVERRIVTATHRDLETSVTSILSD